MLERHEIPTHLEVVDKLVFGLSARQITVLGLGLTLGYTIWQHLGARGLTHVLAHASFASVIPWPLRLLVAALPVMLASAVAFVRWRDRPLEAWGLASLRYLVLAKCAIWRSLPRTVLPQTDKELRTLTGQAMRGNAGAPASDSSWDDEGEWGDRVVPNWDDISPLERPTRQTGQMGTASDPEAAADITTDPTEGMAHPSPWVLPPSPAVSTIGRLMARHQPPARPHSAHRIHRHLAQPAPSRSASGDPDVPPSRLDRQHASAPGRLCNPR